MRLKTSSSLNRKQPSRLRNSVVVLRGASFNRSSSMRAFGIQLFVLILREIIHFDVMAKLVFAGGEGFGPGQQLDQRRLACSVHTHQSDAVAALDHEVALREKPASRHSIFETFWNSATMRPLGFGCGKEK